MASPYVDTVKNPVPEFRELIETPSEGLNPAQVNLLLAATPWELSYVAENAARQEPPNETVLAMVGGICVSRLSQTQYESEGEGRILMSAAGRAIPSLDTATWRPSFAY